MSTEHPNLLKNEIHASSNTGDLFHGHFENRINDLTGVYATGDSQNFHMYRHIIQDLNRKLDQNGFADKIVEPIDAGFRPENFSGFFNQAGTVLNLAGGPNNASAWGVKDLRGNNPLVMRVRRTAGIAGESSYRNFYANEIEDGTLVSWVTAASSTAHGAVDILYDQSDRGYHWYQQESVVMQPKIVVSGVLSRDTENKVAINGKASKMQLADPTSVNFLNFFSNDGTWSLFFVTDFPNYSGASNSNVQIVHFQTQTNGGANSPRKPVIACNRSFNQLAVAQPTQTVGSNTSGNLFMPTYPGEQLLSNFGNPALSTNNHEAFLDGQSRVAGSQKLLSGYATTNDATGVNTNTHGRSHQNLLFMPTETGVTTFLSSLVYAPSYLFDQKSAIESKLVDLHDITFVSQRFSS